MTQDNLTKLAKAAGFLVDGNSWIHAGVVLINGRKSIDEQLKNFANLVAAHKAEVITAEAYRCGYKDGMEAAAVYELAIPDPFAATRRAIVRAAAEIGRSMK